jgi:hypothetical protein
MANERYTLERLQQERTEREERERLEQQEREKQAAKRALLAEGSTEENWEREYKNLEEQRRKQRFTDRENQALEYQRKVSSI